MRSEWRAALSISDRMSVPDVFIVGGGPAGLASAIAAARRGMRVVVADGSRPPIDKACGEGLMPDARRAAARLGITLPVSHGYEFHGIRFLGAGRSVESVFPQGRGVGLRRTLLHEAMIGAAESAGVELRWGTPISDFRKIKARWIIGADGGSSRVRTWAGLNSTRWNTRRFAYRLHLAIAPWSEFMEVHWGSSCQTYITPVSKSEICVAVISRSPELRVYDAIGRFFPELWQRFRGAEITSRERGSVTGTTRLRSVTRGNIALVGDASGSVDAITGEGTCLAFRQAELLADALSADDLTLYEKGHPGLALRHHLMTKVMLVLDRGTAVRRLAMTALASQPRIFKTLMAVHVA